MISKKKIPKTNYVIKKPNLMFKMKPGYKVLWRGYRNEYNMLANLNFYRQKRLTNHFLNFKKTNSLLILRNFEFSIFSVVKRSSFFLDYTYEFGLLGCLEKLVVLGSDATQEV